MSKNKFFGILLAFVVTFSFISLSANAVTEPLGYQINFFDNANLIDDESEQEIIQMAESYKNSLKMDIVFITTTDTNGKSSMIYADDFYDGLEGGHKYNEDGILFLVDLYNSEVYISTVGRAIKLMSDSEIENALDEFFSARGDDDYAAAIYAMSKNALENMSYWMEDGADSIWYYIKPNGTQLLCGLILTVLILVSLYLKHNKANKVVSATHYISEDGYKINNKKVNFVREYPIVHKNYYKESSSSSGGHRSGSSHSSSSGRSHGGGGRSL